jgi:YD repeat-containing protein
MKTVSLLLTLPLLTTTLQANADVNMKDASYYKTWIDLEIQRGSKVFQLRRTYSSRSLHQGLFGFGWCSDLEKSLDLRRKSEEIVLQDCRLNAPIKFKKISPTLYESANKESLEYRDQEYLRTTSKKSLQKFNKNGKLVSLVDASGDRLDLSYDLTGFLTKLRYNNSSEILVRADATKKRILQITTPHNPGVLYTYLGQDLIRVRNAWKNVFTYQYDELHNLTRVQYPNETQELIVYNTEKDWVVKVTNRDLCEDRFKFERQGGSDNYTATAEKHCKNKLVAKTVYEFRHKARADGSKYLDQVKFSQGNKVQRVSYKLPGPLDVTQ